MKKGFIPALGTPLDKDGNLMVASFKKQIEDQINAGAVGLLCMGSMGQEAYIRDDVYPQVAAAAVEAAAGRVPVFVGAMDTSVARIKRRIADLEKLDITGLVFTSSFYEALEPSQIVHFFKKVAALTKHNILIYDLPSVTQAKIQYNHVLELIKTVPNFIGIKSADTVMFRKLKLNPDVPKDFLCIYSGLDMFDIAYKWGIDILLDGMLACTPNNAKKFIEAMNNDDYVTAAKHLDNIVALRDLFIDNDLWPSFTVAMNLLGYEGDFAPDFNFDYTEKAVSAVKAEMIRIGEL